MGRRTEFVYDVLNRQVKQILPEGNSVQCSYDENNNKTKSVDGMYNVTTYVYDALNRLIQAKDAEGNSSYNWYNEDGFLTKSITANGLVTTFRLNELGKTLETRDSLNNSRFFDYDVAGVLTYKKDPRGTEQTFEYDDLYRVLKTYLKNGIDLQTFSYSYDMVGNVKSASNGQVSLVYNTEGTIYSSDPFNRIGKVELKLPGNVSYVTRYEYDNTGQMIGIRYPTSVAWLNYEYDSIGRILAVPGFAGTKVNPAFGYDDNGALASVRTDNGITTSYKRDKNGRITEIGAAKGTTDILTLKYGYNDANNIISRNDNRYVYDKVNRLTQATIFGSFQNEFTKADMLMGTVDQDYSGNKEMEQDITEESEVKLDYSARSLFLNLKVDAENISKLELKPTRATHRLTPEQIEIFYRSTVGFTKLARSKWSGRKDASGKLIIEFSPLLKAQELKVHFNFDDLNMLQLPVDRSEFYNIPADLVAIYQKLPSRTETYTYDALGNRMTETLLVGKERLYTYAYYANSNRLKANGRYAYRYDANGNLVEKGNKYTTDGNQVQFTTSGEGVEYRQYKYDLLNQLVEVKKNGQVVSTYVYDPNGFRVIKKGSKGAIHYVPLLNGEVGYRKEIDTNKQYSFIYVGIQHLARVDGVIGGSGKKFYYHNDHLGTSLVVTDEAGNKVVERDFAPFGERISVSATDTGQAGPNEDDSGFTGKDWDEDIGLYYYNARWYEPTVGKFISVDPRADDPNLYGYGFNNPLKFIDPSGMVSVNYVQGAIGAVSQYVPGVGLAVSGISAFSNFVDPASDLTEKVQKYILGNYEETTQQSNVDTGIEGVTYDSTTTKTYRNHKLVSSETTQTFTNSDGDTVTLNTSSNRSGTQQSYSITKADGTVVVDNQSINYDQNTTDQKNIIAIESFTSDSSNPQMQALMLCVNQEGVFAGFLGSTLPQGGVRNTDGTYSTTNGKIIDEGTYSMYSHYHGGTSWHYPAVSLGDTAYQSSLPATNSEGSSTTAEGVNIHSGQASGRSSTACQNIAPKADYFTINQSSSRLTVHQVNPISRNPGNGDLTLATMRGAWPTWVAFSNIIEIPRTNWDDPNTRVNERGGTYLGNYYLTRL